MKKYLKRNVLPYVIYFLVRLIYLTNKKVFHHAKINSDEAFIFVAWHGDLLAQPINYFAFRKAGTVRAMISQSKDGELIAKIYSLFGVKAIRGSSSKGAAKALISTIKEIKSGSDVAITPDGPRGPRYTIADGVVAIAHKSKAKVIILNSVPSKFWQFNSWDKFILPKPFGKIDFYLSEPYDVSDLEFEEARDFIKEKLMKKAMP